MKKLQNLINTVLCIVFHVGQIYHGMLQNGAAIFYERILFTRKYTNNKNYNIYKNKCYIDV